MGTRADFYVGRGKGAEWLGSIAFDGYPDGLDEGLLAASNETLFRTRVEDLLSSRDDATRPEQGWPWPWADSQTTDFAYAYEGGEVWAACFGHQWFDASGPMPEFDDHEPKTAEFPDMTARKNVAWDRRSGLGFIGFPAA